MHFHIKDRYKNMRSFYETVNSSATNPRNVPNFPPKKWLGNTQPEFINQRSGELENFFNTLLD